MQCYYKDKDGNQCKNEQDDCWCSDEHREIWQSQNYAGVTKRGTRKLTIAEMQKELKRMGAEKIKKSHTQ